jgi:predicted DNA-binding transcriptional regulator AlpA
MSETPTRRKQRRPKITPELLRAPEAAAICGVAVATWTRLNDAGLVPAGFKLAGSRVWRRRELIRWVEAGMPDRSAWEAIERGRGLRIAK